MPTDRMPYDPLDYNLRFFSAKSSQKLGVEQHYAEWLETMFSHFGHNRP